MYTARTSASCASAVDRRTTLLHLFELVAGSDGQRSLRLQEPPFTQLGVGGAIVTVQVVNIPESVATWGVSVVKRLICNSAIFTVKNGRFPISVQYPAISQLQVRLRNGRAFIVGSTIISSRKSPLTDMFRMPKAALKPVHTYKANQSNEDIVGANDSIE